MDLDEAVIEFCSVPRSREELTSFVGKSRNYVMTKVVLPLVDKGKLQLTIPEKPRSNNQKFVEV